MKRIVSIFLALVMVVALFSLVACGDEPAETTASKATQSSETDPVTPGSETQSSATESTASTEGTSGSTDGTTESTSGSTDDPGTSASSDDLDGREKHPDYMDVNFGGAKFVFATQLINDWDCYEISGESTGDDTILDEAIVLRNQIVMDKYSCVIEDLRGENRMDLISNDVSTGQHTVDFLLYQYQNATKGANYLNIANLDIDLTHDWWDQKFIDCFGIDVDGSKRLYTISGQFNLISFDAIWGMYMNRTLYEQLRATGTITDDIYEMIGSGTWTVDAQIKMMSQAAQDVDGNSEFNYNKGDVVGMTTYANNYAERGFFFGVGGRGATKDPASGMPVAINAENFSFFAELGTAVEKAITLTGSGFYQPISGDDVTASFTNGRTLFVSECLAATTRVEDENANITIVPFPKYNETQEDYYHYVCNRGYGLKVSAAVTDRQSVANFLEVFAFHSKQIVYPAYLTYYATQVFRGEEAADILDLVIKTKIYDFDYWLNGGSGIVGLCATYIQNKKATGYSRAITASANTVNTAFTSYVEELRKLTY